MNETTNPKKPVLLLENPKYAGNLGMVCRLIANFDLEPLRIIGEMPSLQFEMEWMAYQAKEEIKKIQIFPDFESATADLHFTIGTGMIHGSDRGRYIPLRKLTHFSETQEGKLGIVFGREDTGLKKTTVELCDRMIDFYLPGYQPSMNLSQSVAYVLGAYFNQQKELSPSISKNPPPSRKHLYKLSQEVFDSLGMTDFHQSEHLALKRWKLILEETKLSQGDMDFLIHFLHRIQGRPK